MVESGLFSFLEWFVRWVFVLDKFKVLVRILFLVYFYVGRKVIFVKLRMIGLRGVVVGIVD